MKPAHFASGFFIALTGQVYTNELLNKVAVIRSNKGLQQSYRAGRGARAAAPGREDRQHDEVAGRRTAPRSGQRCRQQRFCDVSRLPSTPDEGQRLHIYFATCAHLRQPHRRLRGIFSSAPILRETAAGQVRPRNRACARGRTKKRRSGELHRTPARRRGFRGPRTRRELRERLRRARPGARVENRRRHARRNEKPSAASAPTWTVTATTGKSATTHSGSSLG